MSITANEKRLGTELLEAGRLTESSLNEAIERRNADRNLSFPRILVQQGFLKAEELVDYFAERYRMPSVDLSATEIDPAAVALVPYSLCTEHVMMPLSLEGDVLSVAIADPLLYVPVEQDLQAETGRAVAMSIASEKQIRTTMQAHYSHENSGDAIQIKFDAPTNAPDEVDENTDELEQASESASGVLNNILAQALGRRASDIHFEPGEQFLRVRLRVDGVLEDALSLPTQMLQPLVTRVKVAARLDIGERRFPQDGNISLTAFGRAVDLRVNTLPTIWGERVVMRILDKSSVPQGLDAVGLEADVLAEFKACLDAPHGVVLVTGPTGSGKTTTLYAALNYLAEPGVNILTVEDPVEYKISGISQVQTYSKIGYDFQRALEAFLRQDPDVILLGEIRNEETANVAMQASMTGHMVLSTLHMHSAAEAVTRLIEMNIKQYVVGSTLRGVMAQRLVRTVCTHCKVNDETRPDLVEKFGLDPAAVMRGQGCEKCSYTGNHGRTAINELLVVNEEVRAKIMASATAHEVELTARRGGMRSLAESALLKVSKGETALDQVLPYLSELSEQPAFQGDPVASGG